LRESRFFCLARSARGVNELLITTDVAELLLLVAVSMLGTVLLLVAVSMLGTVLLLVAVSKLGTVLLLVAVSKLGTVLLLAAVSKLGLSSATLSTLVSRDESVSVATDTPGNGRSVLVAAGYLAGGSVLLARSTLRPWD